MFPTTTLIVLLLVCGTTVCQAENSALTARFRRQSQSQNANDWRYSPSKRTNKSLLEETIRSTFIIRNGSGIELFNLTNKSGPPGSTTGGEIQTQAPATGKEKDEVNVDLKCQQGGKSFCTEVQNYPAQELQTALKDQLSKFDILFGDDDVQQPINISQRTDPGENSLCESVEKIVYPKLAESKDLKWLYIINVPNYTQGVKIEECLHPDSACTFTESFPSGYTTKCKQNYSFRQLVAMTLDRQVIKDLFKFPSCCKCIIKQL